MNRWARRALIVAAALYLLALNLPIWAGVVPRLVNAPSFRASYAFGLSVWPGRATLWGVRLKAVDSSNVSDLRLGRFTVAFSLRELRQKRLTVSQAWAHGASVRVEQARLPQPPEPPPAAGAPEGSEWKIAVARVRVSDLRSVWVHGLDWQGEARIDGEFELQPGRRLAVGDTAVEFLSGGITLGETRWLEQTQGKLAASIDPTDIRGSVDEDPLGRLKVGGALHARIADPSAATYTLRGFKSLEFLSGSGELTFQPKLERGVFRPGTRLEAQLRDLRLKLDRFQLKAEGSVLVEVQGARLRTVARLDPLRWEPLASNCPRAAAAVTTAELRTEAPADFLLKERALADIGIRLGLASRELPPLACVLKSAFGETLLPGLDGELADLRVDGELRTGAHRFSGDARLRLVRVQFSTAKGDARAELQGRLTAHAESLDYQAARFTLPTAELQWQAQRLWSEKEGWVAQDWKGGLQLSRGHLDASKPRTELQGDMRVRLSDIRYPVRLFFPDAKLINFGAKLVPMSKFDGLGRLRVQGEGVRISAFTARSQTGRMEADLRSDARGFHGESLLQLTPFTTCFVLRGDTVDTDLSHPIDTCAKARAQSR